MQPILAESAPHRGRAIAFVALAVVTSLIVLAVCPHRGHHGPRHGRSELRQIGKCISVHGVAYRVVVR
jgi:hypothetical protein